MKKAAAIIALALLATAAHGQVGKERDLSGNQINAEFYLEIAKGDVKSHTVVNKFGEALAVGTTWTVVSETKTYPTPTTAAALEVVSSSDVDSTGNAGAQYVIVQGIGPDWKEQTERVALKGTQAVDLTNTWLRVYRMWVDESNTYASTSATTHEGTITLRADGGGTSWAQITKDGILGLGQTLIGAYTVPLGKTAYLTQYTADIEPTKNANIAFFKRCDADDISAPYDGTMRLQALHRGIQNTIDISNHVARGPFVGPCDIGFFAKVSNNTANISLQFNFVLVDNGE
jgi:hypothetical protein